MSTASVKYLLLVRLAFQGGVNGLAVENVRIPRADINMLEKTIVHEVSKANSEISKDDEIDKGRTCSSDRDLHRDPNTRRD